MNNITRAGLPDRLRALAEDEIKGISAVLSPGNSHDLLAAADEIERLRSLVRFQDGVIRSGDVACLTGAEREAVKTCIADDEAMTHHSRAATLRGLLDRLGSE